ncbi:UDP-3-O-(3-hydroxymyristoyl)glucosamine N-acyltransferase [Devosia rhodophyticola]|uniref:UDP-3-O-acylglucosamine N-acyltransferase n=1 Tax=Devosia rhodophyticola TaxID=3026423 RepID=A0ABY7YWX3_9HYPH|nr:UDP-3-O-(3-hydroxymyristoyl)glucosamine N-acyltransferase [Devosia rhodophyticola]WDR05900.1 UDP-3-O-(3-hydroxymyristoyl)glucosamine N-acyltransferase [Devosia rhodophyticola]
MVDIRFHRFSGPTPLGKILSDIGFVAPGLAADASAFVVQGANEVALADSGELVLAANARYTAELSRTHAGVAIILPALRDAVPPHTFAIEAERPHEIFADILDHLYPKGRIPDLTLASDEPQSPLIEADVAIGPGAVIGENVEIGRGSVIGANTVIGSGVTIGRNCVIGPNATIDCAHIGNDVVVHSGVRIGTEGFGWLDFGRTNRKVPQLGRVIVQDRVEIGANSTIDRGALGDTVIGEGTKIDNLVQIGHNCRIGRNCLIAAMSGLSGSTIVGDGVLMGGGVGTSGHLNIGSGSVVHGRAAVTKDWPAGSKLAGAPAQDIRDFWRELATMRKMSKGEPRK